jgi:hypothetical protein
VARPDDRLRRRAYRGNGRVPRPTSLVLGIFFALLMPRNVAKGGFDEEEVVHVTPAGVVE